MHVVSAQSQGKFTDQKIITSILQTVFPQTQSASSDVYIHVGRAYTERPEEGSAEGSHVNKLYCLRMFE